MSVRNIVAKKGPKIAVCAISSSSLKNRKLRIANIHFRSLSLSRGCRFSLFSAKPCTPCSTFLLARAPRSRKSTALSRERAGAHKARVRAAATAPRRVDAPAAPLNHFVAGQGFQFGPAKPEPFAVDALIVVADADRAAPNRSRRPRELRYDADSLDASDLLVFPLDMNPARLIVRIFRGVLGRHNRRAWHLRLVEEPDDLGGGTLGDPSAQNRVKLDTLDRVEIGLRVLPSGLFRVEADRAQQTIVHFGQRAHHDPSVAGLKAVERLEALRLVTRALTHEALVKIFEHRAAKHPMNSFELRKVDGLALAVGARVGERGERRRQREHRGHVISRPRRRAARGMVGITGLIHHPGKSLAHHIVRGAPHVARLPGLVEAGYVRNDEPGIDLPKGLVVEPPSRISAGLGAFHPDVAFGGDFKKKVATARLGEVERDAQHVAPLLYPVGCDARPAVARGKLDAEQAPSHVPCSRAFDLDHLRAHLGAHRGREGLGNQRTGRDDSHALERSERFRYERFSRHSDLLPLRKLLAR